MKLLDLLDNIVIKYYLNYVLFDTEKYLVQNNGHI